MQFNLLALAVMAATSVAATQSTVTVTVCSTTATPAEVSTYPGVAFSSGVASSTIGTVGSKTFKSVPTPTSSPIAFATGAASANDVSGSAIGLIVAGGIALPL